MGYNPSFSALTGFINVNLKCSHSASVTCRIHFSEQCVIGKKVVIQS